MVSRLIRYLVFLSAVLLMVTACSPETLGPILGTTVPDPTATSQPTPAPSATPAPASGIDGQILIGPACPVVRIDTPCPDQPFQATVTILGPGNQAIQQVKSNEQGEFRVELPPGKYTLRPESPDGFVRAGEQEVTVTSGTFISVTITFDSGIR